MPSNKYIENMKNIEMSENKRKLKRFLESKIMTTSLVAKWMPRPSGGNRENKRWASAIRKHMDLTPKAYRTLLVENTNVVEQLMCSKDFGSIEYGKIPSKAMSDYMKAFGKNDYERFSGYLNAVDKGEDKINAGAVYPYDILKNMKHGSKDGADTQWNALPNYMEGNAERVLPIVDVSSSMNTSAGGSSATSCMDVAISLGLYISERNEGPFKNAFFTFDDNPTLEFINAKTLNDRYRQMHSANWGGSTNFEATFKLLLNKAVAGNISEDEMPTMILVLSDMEFNSADGSYSWNGRQNGNDGTWSPTAQAMIGEMYNNAGYKVPKMVYWNIQSRGDNNKPVQFDKNGTALVSGFSPALLTSLLSGKDMTPYSMMMNVIGSDRYTEITI